MPSSTWCTCIERGLSRRSLRAPARLPGRAPGRGCAWRTSCGRARRHRGRAGSQASAAGPRSAARADQRPGAASGRSRSPGPHSRAGDRAGPCGADARPPAPRALPRPSGSHAAAAPCHTPASWRPCSAPVESCDGAPHWPLEHEQAAPYAGDTRIQSLQASNYAPTLAGELLIALQADAAGVRRFGHHPACPGCCPPWNARSC